MIFIEGESYLVAFGKDWVRRIYGFLSFGPIGASRYWIRISITEAWIEIKNSSINKERDKMSDITFEFIDLEEFSYQDIKNRERIEYIGYEISSMELRKKRGHSSYLTLIRYWHLRRSERLERRRSL